MKKLLTVLFATVFCATAANAELRAGISGAYTMFTADGTETVKSSAKIANLMMMKQLFHLSL